MAANQAIQFTISTVDKATATINRINNTVSRMTRPYANLTRQVQRFSRASGLTQVGQKLEVVAQKAGKAASSLTRMGAPLLALVGGGTLAGLTDMVVQWERMGAETERTSRLLGITANQLTQMRSAASLMGVSADSMTSGFRSFADTLQDARWGRNQGAFATIQALGVSLHTTRTGAIDTQAALYDLADRIHTIQQTDPAAARNLARSLGVEQLLPVLIQGRQGMQAYEAEARRLRGDFTPQMAARAQAFALSLTKMGTAADGLKASIADSLAPVLGPLVDRFTEWIAKNRELISQRVAQLVAQVARWLQSVDWNQFAQGVTDAVAGLISFATWVGKVVNAIGGWKVAAITIAAYMVGGFALSVVSTIASIALLIARLGKLADSYTTVGRAAQQTGARIRSGARMGGGFRAGLRGGAAVAGIGGALELANIATSNESAARKRADASGAIGGTAGAIGGAALGGALGSVVPVVGTSIGAALGGVAGEWIGRKIGGAAGEALFSNARDKGITGAGTGGGAGAVASPPVAAGAVAARVAGLSAPVGQWATRLDFAGTERRYGLPSGLLSAMAQQESGGNAGAVSRAGARGLFQFMPSTEREYGINALDPAQSANAAARKMSGLLARYHGNMTAALSAYNWGEGNLDRKGLANAPAETRNYAPSIMARMASLNPAANDPSLYAAASPGASQAAAAPVVHVDNHVHIARDGSVTVKTRTPAGLKIARPMEAA